MFAVELEQSTARRSKPHGAFVVLQQGVGRVLQVALRASRVESVASQFVRLGIERGDRAVWTVDDPKHAETVFVEPEPDTRLPCKDVPLHLSSVPIKFVERLAGADPKPAFSVLTSGRDSAIPEAGRVSRGVVKVLALTRDGIQPELSFPRGQP